MRKVLKALAGVACLAVAVGVALLSLPSVTGVQSLVVRTGSMGGAAPTGSLVVGRVLDAVDVENGDVILLSRAVEDRVLEPVLHRVIERRVDESGQILVRTKGDANRAPDPGEYILRGRTLTPILVVPRLGRAVAALRTPAGWFGFVVLPTVLAGALWLRQIWGHREKRDRDASPSCVQDVDACAYTP
jgi:signal peptidase I